MSHGSQSRIDQGLTPFVEDAARLQAIALILAPYLEERDPDTKEDRETR